MAENKKFTIEELAAKVEALEAIVSELAEKLEAANAVKDTDAVTVGDKTEKLEVPGEAVKVGSEAYKCLHAALRHKGERVIMSEAVKNPALFTELVKAYPGSFEKA